jgi:hypothetical protein
MRSVGMKSTRRFAFVLAGLALSSLLAHAQDAPPAGKQTAAPPAL